jgi:excisionase family DNA binding protein
MSDVPTQRFLTLDEVAEEVATSQNQIYALVRTGQLGAIKVGGRGQWRVGRQDLEEYVERLYAETRAYNEANPYPGPDAETSATLTGMTDEFPPQAAVSRGNHTQAQRSAARPEAAAELDPEP